MEVERIAIQQEISCSRSRLFSPEKDIPERSNGRYFWEHQKGSKVIERDTALVEGLQTRFACGRGYDKVRQLPYVAPPSYTTLLEKIKSIHFDTGNVLALLNCR